MSPYLVVLGGFVIIYLIILSLGSNVGSMLPQPGPPGGQMEAPINLDELLPLALAYDKSLSDDIRRRLTPVDSVTIHEFLQEQEAANSAIIELNIAKLALDALEGRAPQIDVDKVKNIIPVVLDTAESFIRDHRSRYPVGLKAYLQHQRNRWRKL